MLLIGDIHLNSRIKDKLLNSLRSFIQKHNEENNIIFLGDFVYHFSYDRKALLELYDLFIELYSYGKNLYILAGNHDWLGNTFVFEEGKKAFEVLSKLKDKDNEICFITKPLVKEIEGKNICFLPAMLEINEEEYKGIEELKDKEYEELMKSKNKNINFSAQLNLLVKWFMKEYSDVILIHHYYIEGISFPGQKAKFDFKDRALSHNFLEQKTQIISGHLHQPFAYKNYLCTGSIWATSPLETDQIKYFFILKNGKFFAEETGMNYYFMMERKKGTADLFTQEYKPISNDDIINYRKVIQNKSLENFKEGIFKIEESLQDNLDFKNVSLSIGVEKIQNNDMSELIDLNLQQTLQNIQLKKNTISTENLLEQLQKPDLAGQLNFGNWIELLKNFLKKQYPNDYEEYEKLLQDMKIL